MKGRRRRPAQAPAGDAKQALVAATIASLKRHGHEGLSVRRIAAEAGVSIGLINHHFPSKDALVAESYREFNRQLSEKFAAAVERAGPAPRERLHAFFESVFSRPNLDPQVLTAWIVYWSLFRQSARIRKVHAEAARGYGDLPQALLSELADEEGLEFDPRLAAIGLTALLDGLWLEWCLDPKGFKPAEAVSLCESWVASLGA